MKYYSIITLLVLSLGCANSKSGSSPTNTLTFNGISQGKDNTAIIGNIKSIEEKGGEIIVELLVTSMRQGGSTAPAFGVNAKTTVAFSPLFQKNYADQNGVSVSSEINQDDTILVIVNKDLRSQQNQVVQLKTQN